MGGPAVVVVLGCGVCVMLPCRVLQVDAVMREHAWQMLQQAVVQAQVPSTRACSCVPLHHTGDALVTTLRCWQAHAAMQMVSD